ncbi:MAG: ABC transporter permease [Nitrospira sp.]|nr:MAG: ABC transporter permease [Nitrospira sp.]
MDERATEAIHVSQPKFVIEARRGLFNIDLAELWQFRELLYFMVWRDIKVRYKQTIIGAGWAVFQPLITMLIFTAIFGWAVKIPSDGVPYPVFSFSALLIWACFAQSVTRSGASLVAEGGLIKKIYFPRLVVPISAIASPVLDLCFSVPVLVGLLLYFGIMPGWHIVFLPLVVLATILTAMALGLWLSALNAQYRDIGYVVPFMMQLGMFASPVVYPISLISDQWKYVYSLNPMVGIIQGFRWAVFGGAAPAPDLLMLNGVIVLVVLLTGLVYFKRTEPLMPDII